MPIGDRPRAPKVAKEFSVTLGGNTYINTPRLVVYKSEPLFQMRRSDSDGMLDIDVDVFDANNNRGATVRKGIVIQGDAKNYDIQTGHEKYSVTEKITGRVIVSVKRRGVEGAELEVSVCLYTPDGFLFEATPTTTNVEGLVMTDCTIEDCGAGIVIQ